MGNEKWILYNNREQSRSWGKWKETPSTTQKAGLHPKKVMLCMWWNWKGVFYYEFLLENQTINPTSTAPHETTWQQHLKKSIWISQQKTRTPAG